MATTARKASTKAKTTKKAAKKAAPKAASTASKTAEMTAPELAAKIRAQDPFSFQAEFSTDELVAAQAEAQKAFEALGLKTMEFTQANIEATTEAAQELMAVKDATQFVDLQTAHLGKAMERGAAQFLELQALTLDAVAAAGKPFGQNPFLPR